MAAIIPTEGRDYLLGLVPKITTAVPANLYLGLFTGGSASTVPAVGATLAAMGGGFAEAAGSWGYARVAVASGDWGSPATETIQGVAGVRVLTATQKAFVAASTTYATAINGFFLASASTSGVCVYYSNFTDTTAIASLALGDIIRITPKFGLTGPA